MDSALLIELAKLGLQGAFALMASAGLTEEQEATLVETERERFRANRAKVLPDV